MPLSRITLRQLEAFVTVAELQSFAAASQRLGLTSSAVSQLIAELESVLGFRVFDRSTRRVSLSGGGREYIGSARTVLTHLQLAESAAADVRNRAAGVVRIGAPQVLAGSVLPRMVREFTAARPKVVIRIRDTPVEHLVDTVASGDVDLSVGPDRPHGSDVSREPVLESPWVLWCAAHHPLAARKSLKWADLRNAPLVSAGRDHERSVAQMRLSAPEGERIRPVDVVDNITTALGMAAEGLAATLSPAYVGVLAVKYGLVMRRVTDPETIRQVCVYRPTTRAITPAAEAFGEFVAEQLRKMKPSPARRRPRSDSDAPQAM